MFTYKKNNAKMAWDYGCDPLFQGGCIIKCFWNYTEKIPLRCSQSVKHASDQSVILNPVLSKSRSYRPLHTLIWKTVAKKFKDKSVHTLCYIQSSRTYCDHLGFKYSWFSICRLYRPLHTLIWKTVSKKFKDKSVHTLNAYTVREGPTIHCCGLF